MLEILLVKKGPEKDIKYKKEKQNHKSVNAESAFTELEEEFLFQR